MATRLSTPPYCIWTLAAKAYAIGEVQLYLTIFLTSAWSVPQCNMTSRDSQVSPKLQRKKIMFWDFDRKRWFRFTEDEANFAEKSFGFSRCRLDGQICPCYIAEYALIRVVPVFRPDVQRASSVFLKLFRNSYAVLGESVSPHGNWPLSLASSCFFASAPLLISNLALSILALYPISNNLDTSLTAVSLDLVKRTLCHCNKIYFE